MTSAIKVLSQYPSSCPSRGVYPKRRKSANHTLSDHCEKCGSESLRADPGESLYPPPRSRPRVQYFRTEGQTQSALRDRRSVSLSRCSKNLPGRAPLTTARIMLYQAQPELKVRKKSEVPA